jgi:hypothetical protein
MWSVAPNGYTVHQRDKLGKICRPEMVSNIVSGCAALHYISGCTSPDIYNCFQLLSTAVATLTKKTHCYLWMILGWLKETDALVLKFVPLDMRTSRMVVFTNASFANASDLDSQLGFVVCLVEDGGVVFRLD